MTVGDKIKALRKAIGLTQTELGQRVGVQKNAVSKWECGRVEDIPTSTIKRLANLFDVPASYLIDDDAPVYHRSLTPLTNMKQWKVIGGTACGAPVHREMDDIILAPANIHADRVFRCIGDSMIGAHIFDGDIVFIKTGEYVEDGRIGVVRIGDEYSLKRIFRGDDYLELRSENPAYPPIIIRGEQENAEIVGKAVQCLTRII